MLAVQHAQFPGFTTDIYEQLSPSHEQCDSIPRDDAPRSDSVVDEAVAPCAVIIESEQTEDEGKVPCMICPPAANEGVEPPKHPATCPPQLSLAPNSSSDEQEQVPPPPTPSRSRPCQSPRRPKSINSSAALNYRNSSTLSLGPSAYVYTPTTARSQGFESLRDDHGIVYKKKRNLVERVLVALGWRRMGTGLMVKR